MAMFESLPHLALRARRDVLRMTTSAGSGHPGGSLSSLDIYILLLAIKTDADTLVVSHGHTAAGLYAALARFGYIDGEAAVQGFRRMGSPFEGHPSLDVPGVAWCSGALGQGLSVGCGYALAAQKLQTGGHVYVVMGDGEQAKGQLCEAREFAVAHRLSNLTAIVDCNGLQASGSLDEVLHQDIAAKHEAAGWAALEADGHEFDALYDALRTLRQAGKPGVLLAHTVMGKGVPGHENDYTFHGNPLKPAELEAILECS
ncbi:MAG: thiamine pyrophosphate-dependent enzyme [Defluviitaleaceae bacterium]|nr:thiamine pyrophosphate-dependent enzyme [Defluviitaleaceae bacterium]